MNDAKGRRRGPESTRRYGFAARFSAIKIKELAEHHTLAPHRFVGRRIFLVTRVQTELSFGGIDGRAIERIEYEVASKINCLAYVSQQVSTPLLKGKGNGDR